MEVPDFKPKFQIPDNHWLVRNVEEQLRVVEPTLIIRAKQGLVLPQRLILNATIGLPYEERMIATDSKEVLYSQRKIADICGIELNTGKEPPLVLNPMSNGDQRIDALMIEVAHHLYENLDSLLKQPAA